MSRPSSVVSSLDFCCNNVFWSPSICVVTKFSCRDLAVLPFTEFYVMTKFLCRDTIFVASQFDPWLLLLFYVATSLGCLMLSFKLRLKTADLLNSLS